MARPVRRGPTNHRTQHRHRRRSVHSSRGYARNFSIAAYGHRQFVDAACVDRYAARGPRQRLASCLWPPEASRTLEQARAETATFFAHLEKEFPKTNTNLTWLVSSNDGQNP